MHLLIYVNALDLLHGKTLSRRDLRVLPYQKRLQDCSDFIDGSNSIWLYKERNFKNILTFAISRVFGKSPVRSRTSYRSLKVLSTESNMWLAEPARSIHVHLWLYCVSVSRWWSTVILLWILTFPASESILESRQKCSHGPFLLEHVPLIFYKDSQFLLLALMLKEVLLL